MRDRDLNLLKVLSLLLEETSVSRAAARLGLTQPALSKALSRLRAEFADPLFVRAPGGVTPTTKALELEAILSDVMDRLETLYAPSRAFTPATVKGTVRLAANNYFEQVVWSKLAGPLAREAPQLTVVNELTGLVLPEEDLREGRVHLAISSNFGALPGGFMRQSLVSDRFVAVARRGHPLIKKRLDLAAFLKAGHLLVSPRGEQRGVVDEALKKIGRERHIAVVVSSLLPCGPMLASSDLIMTAPARLIEALVPHFPLVVHDLPIALPPLSLAQVWHERFRDDPLHRWVRAAIRDAAGRTAET